MMFAAIVYTVLSVLNLIGYVTGVLFLPAETPIHFDGALTADAVGSPWVFVSLPAAAALISAAIWTSSLSKREKNRKILIGALSAVGAVLAVIGWVFFALIAGGVQAGERANFPVVLCVVMPLSLLVVFSGVLIRKIKRNKLLELVSVSAEKNPRASGRANRLLGILLIAAGGVSAALSAALSCLRPQLCYLSAIVLACGVLISLAASLIFARVWAGKELQEAEGDKEQI